MVAETVSFTLLTYQVKFSESGLPAGSPWYVNLTGGNSYSSTSVTLTFYLPNGTYDYSITGDHKIYSPKPGSGTFSISGSGYTGSTTFTEATYTVTFNEQGLPAGNDWYVNITGIPSSGPLSSETYGKSLPNGTYHFSIGTNNDSYEAQPGTFTVSGTIPPEQVMFKPVQYNVTFFARYYNPSTPGHPTGIKWYLNLSNGQDFSSDTGNMTFYLSNGTYSYTVSIPYPTYEPFHTSGTFTIDGANYSSTVLFKTVRYNITINEKGLPTNAPSLQRTWSVKIGNMTFGPTSESRIFAQLENGTYTYTLSTSNASMVPVSQSGTFVVHGSNLSINVTFRLLFEVTLKENGLPNNVAWQLKESNGTMLSSMSGEINLKESNGTYNYSINNLTAYYTTEPSVTVTVNGSNVTESVQFFHYSYITGNISPAGAIVYVNGQKLSTSSSSFNISVPNGTYKVKVTMQGYQTYYDNFTLAHNATKNLSISLTKKGGSFPLSGPELVGVIGGVAAAVVIGSVLTILRRRR